MSELLGFTSIAIVSLYTLILSIKCPSITRILFSALILRVIFMLVGHYLVNLPDSDADASTFEYVAWLLAEDGFFNLIDNYYGMDSRFISWLIAIPYSLFGRSILMAKSISLFFGINCVYLAYKVAKDLWDKDIAQKVGWAVALFPSLILYSVLTMREVYVCFFLLLGVHGIINWLKYYDFKSLILTILGFIGATYFHGAMILGLIAFFVITILLSLKKFVLSLIKSKINVKFFIIFLISLIGSGLFFTNKISVPKIGNILKAGSAENLGLKMKSSTRGVASYPEWLEPQSTFEMIYKIPLRSIYLLFSPFPWEVKRIKHLIGMLDSFLYMYLFVLIFRNRKIIWNNPYLKIISIILIFYLLIFAVGVGNFGTGIRHRSKFVIILILLAAPLLNRLIFFKNTKKINFK